MENDDSQDNQAAAALAAHAPAQPITTDINTTARQPTTTSRTKDLDKTKRRALEALVALMPQLNNLEPEQRFRICIEAIRFTDDQNLVDAALDAGLAIEDAETQANALLEIVAEINYLEQQDQ
ncbi:MAG: hypothetical protein JWP06_14 [Candidatus Saccharibacteria bacterium]|nr:hypothetical protein [Candidatus Saccharibacteria bacterium]